MRTAVVATALCRRKNTANLMTLLMPTERRHYK